MRHFQSASRSTFRAPWWLPGGNAQTIYAALAAPAPRVRYRRERWDTPDADFVDVDWLDSRAEGPARGRRDESTSAPTGASTDAPLVVLFHGLEGSSGSHYARAVMAAARARNWRGAVPHFRGCGGEPNRLPRAYHSGDSAEVDWLLRRFRSAAGAAPLFAIGVSLGGNVLLKWLGEHGAAARDILAAAAAVSAPVDLTAAGNALGRGFNLVYARHFLATLKRKTAAKIARFPGLADAAAVARSRTLREFDDLVTAPLHGFRDASDYWLRSSAKPLLGEIRVPTLIVHARNDPFHPGAHLPGHGEVSADVVLDFPDTGGHVGFVSGRFPGKLAWLPERVLGFFDERIRAGASASDGKALDEAHRDAAQRHRS